MLLAVLVVGILVRGGEEPPPLEVRGGATSSTRGGGVMNALVLRVIDGDTVEVAMDGEKEPIKVRLLGVNTPESVDIRRPVECFGKEASRFLQTLVEGQRVRLEEDLQADERDKYARLLRNVFLEDGTDVNAAMVEQGYAYAYLAYPLNKQRKNELRRLQEEAKLAGRGLWSVETCDGMK